jgi:hypothetical protein
MRRQIGGHWPTSEDQSGSIAEWPTTPWSLFITTFALRSAEFLRDSDENPFRTADVAEPMRVFVLDYFAYEARAALAKAVKRLVDVVNGEHDAEGRSRDSRVH